MNREDTNTDLYSESFGFFRKIEKSLAAKLGLSSLHAGLQVIRNEKGWRENEKSIQYCWIATISRSLAGWASLFAMKFNQHTFRENVNQEEVVQGIFSTDEHGVNELYVKTSSDAMIDITDFFKFNLADAGSGITLDGVSYTIRIIAPNIDTFIHLNNPRTAAWEKWQSEIWAMGKALAIESGNEDWLMLFS